jgi:Zn-dependent peptidase ImmA (M78 family)
MDFDSGVQTLTALGAQLAQAYASSTNPRVCQAVKQWHNRIQALSDQQFVSVSTGWPEQDLTLIQSGSTTAEFWFNGQNRHIAAANDNEFLAAARMLRHTGKAHSVAQVLQLIRQLPQAKTTNELDELSRECLAHLQKQNLRDPWAQGYATAQWLSGCLKLDPEKRCDPESILRDWGVDIREENLLIPELDALAVWGARGPSVLINAHDKARSRQKVRRRSTLAHEIAHLLLDRHDGLPVLEVLGGRVNMFVEQRANAFAAELLLPRLTAGRLYQRANDLESALKNMSRHYEVGKSLAINQLHNSGLPAGHDFVALQQMQSGHVQH